jgi:hypothetical protein
MTEQAERWILAFDASCARCQKISHVVAEACEGKLEVLPLSHSDVRTWREHALGQPVPWVPTLINWRHDNIRAWTGSGMALPLMRRLGLRSTLRLLRAFGELRDEQPKAAGGLGRKEFLRLGAGLGVAVGLVLTGRSPAMAATESAEAVAWLRANPGRLPERYDDFAQFTVAYRQAIFGELAPRVRRDLWTEHLRRYAAARPPLSPQQLQVIERAEQVLGDEATFAGRSAAVDGRLGELRDAAIEAFGREEARRLIATLGPDERGVDPALADCECSTVSDYCWYHCSQADNCNWTSSGCGTAWQYPCNGICMG